ncbi:MAG: single-stranded DNA-binding protein [Armatimonadota bacterium]|nr:single-stranded DNA-binding protein [Armatimonadota bacterium]MDW8105314.1 single-stranded DNA-binding protein [Armatimonadota bacterium]MDW8289256.1 single-stranded DNA-binding protein [Armatimonadota bacterium]
MYNRVILIGRLVRDPEYRSTPEGVTLARMRIAVNRMRSRETGEQQTDFIDLVAWRQQAEFAINYLKKGRLILVEGRLQVRDWLSPEGDRRRAYEVVVDRLAGLDRPRDAEGIVEEEAVTAPVTSASTAAPPRTAVSTPSPRMEEPADPFLGDEDMLEEEEFEDYDPFADTDEE